MLELMHDAGLRTVALVKTTEATMWKHGLKCWVPSVPAVTGRPFSGFGQVLEIGCITVESESAAGFLVCSIANSSCFG